MIMARKRYETAFIPASSSPTQYPDVDSLLLSIESFSLSNETESEKKKRRDWSDFQYRRRSKSVNHDNFYDKSEPSISYSVYHPTSKFGSNEDTSIVNKEQGRIRNLNYSGYQNVQIEATIRGKSCSESPVRKMSISFSEPPRPKHTYMKSYSSLQSSSGCSTTNSSSPVPSEAGRKSRRVNRTTITTVPPKRNVLSIMKVNSASSLDSIDSAKSDDFKYLTKGSQYQCPTSSNKLLSPISDKSPMDPPVNTTSHGLPEVIQHEMHYNLKKQNLLAAAEQLTNLPWEMPKLKRKLALLVDSGISLNCPGSSEIKPRRLKSQYSPLINSEINTSNDKGIPPTVPLHQQEIENEMTQDEKNQSEKIESNDVPPGEVPPPPNISNFKPDRCKMKLDFNVSSIKKSKCSELINTKLKLEGQDWFHGAITRVEAEEILRTTKEGSFLVRHCESSVFNRYSLSLKTSRGFIHVRIEPNSESGEFSLGNEREGTFPSVPLLILHFMSHRLPMKGTEHVHLKYPVVTNFL